MIHLPCTYIIILYVQEKSKCRQMLYYVMYLVTAGISQTIANVHNFIYIF